MTSLTYLINYLLPLLGLILIIFGFIKNRINYTLLALWIAIVALFLQYREAGGEILGPYFDYQNAAIYSINLIILLAALIYICLKAPLFKIRAFPFLVSFMIACFVTAGSLLAINLWMNAYFIETKLPGTAILQVATFTPKQHCKYKYVFYKVNQEGKIGFLCPNHYGLIPSMGQLEVLPDYLSKQLSEGVSIRRLLEQKLNHKD